MLPLPSLELLERYNRPGPRYTSYPPATEFTPTFGAIDAEAQLRKADGLDAPLSLYVHVPFCAEMCRFCGCNVVATIDRSRGDGYLDELEREVGIWAERLPNRRLVSQLHLGGGTPTWLTLDQLERLHSILASRFRFTSDAELALEADPAVTTVDQIALLGRLGFNRISVGIQDLNPQVQQAVNRIQSAEQTELIISSARANGFRNVNVDLMYGLPYQTEETYRVTMRRVLEMKPDRMALFGYAHVPWVKPHQRLMPQAHMPNAEQRVNLFVTAARILEDEGFRQIGLDHFARAEDPLSKAQEQGSLTRNFQGYSTKVAPDVVAFGVSAISDVAGAFMQSSHKLQDWSAAVNSGRLPIERGLVRNAQDELRGAAIRRLMCLLHFEVQPLADEFGEGAWALYEEAKPRLEPLAQDDLLVFKDGGFDVTPLGRLFLRNIAMTFDSYLPTDGVERRAFSRTV